jgi:hypothetical protein
MPEQVIESILALDWFVTHLTHIRKGDWMAQALTIGSHPLTGYTCAASGTTIALALANLLDKLENGFDLVPPLKPATTNHDVPNIMDLLKIPSAPVIPHITRRI